MYVRGFPDIICPCPTIATRVSRMVMMVCFIFISFYPGKVMSIIWYAQGNDEKTAKGGVTAFLDLKC
jgi:hypothetical protein